MTQLSSNDNASATYTCGKNEHKKQNINLNLTWQQASDKQGDVRQHTGNQFYNANVAYALNLVPRQMTISVSFNGTLNNGVNLHSKTFGPTTAINKSFFDKKLRATFSTSCNNTYTNGALVNSIVNARLNGNITVHKKHNISLSMAMVNRKSKTGEHSNSFTDYTGTLGYNYTFGMK